MEGESEILHKVTVHPRHNVTTHKQYHNKTAPGSASNAEFYIAVVSVLPYFPSDR